MNILMFGPAYGHNIQPFLDYFQNSEEHKLTLVFFGEGSFSKEENYSKIKFIRLNLNPINFIQIIKQIRIKSDFIWLHVSSLIDFSIVNFFKSKKTYLVANIWSERVPRKAVEKNWEGRYWSYLLNNSDAIQCNWYGTQVLMSKVVPPSKVNVVPWGLHHDFLNENTSNIEEFTGKFVDSLPKNKTKFFYPKSITFSSDHSAIINAVNELVQKSITNFVVYFWMGNILDEQRLNLLKKKIENLKLGEYVKIQKHPYLSFNDIRYIWENMDIGLQIALYDQLSTTLIEPIYLKKEVIVTDIFPYKKLIEKYPKMKLPLIENTTENIAEKMKDFIDGNKTEEALLEVRKKVIQNDFIFDQNITKILSDYSEKIKDTTKNRSSK